MEMVILCVLMGDGGGGLASDDRAEKDSEKVFSELPYLAKLLSSQTDVHYVSLLSNF